MRPTNIALLVGTAILFLLTGETLSESPTSAVALRALNEAQNKAVNGKTFLRALQTTETKDEERAFSFASLKKLLPGTSAYEAARPERIYKRLAAEQMKGFRKIAAQKAAKAAKASKEAAKVAKAQEKAKRGAWVDELLAKGFYEKRAQFDNCAEQGLESGGLLKMLKEAGRTSKRDMSILDEYTLFRGHYSA